MDRPLIVYTTFADADTALAIGEALVRENLCACVNVLPGMRSVYAWNGAIEHSEEVVAILKTRDACGSALMHALRERHPYETPIILALSTSDAHPDTAAWIAAQTGG